MDDLKKKIEAILFSIGKFISLEDISNLCNEDQPKVKDALLELTTDYENKKSSLLVINDDDQWKLTTREEYGNIVRKIVSETELTKTQLETLAVIAFKYPIKQSDLIRIRTNKAYDHLMELERVGYITRQRYGRSRLIKLTDKFFEYFDLPREKLKDRFKGFEQLAQKIENKEEEVEHAKGEQKKAAEHAKEDAEKERKVMDGEIELEIIDEDEKGSDKIETYGIDLPKGKIEEVKEKLGDLEVVDEPPFEEKEDFEQKNEIMNQDIKDDKKESSDENIIDNQIDGLDDQEEKEIEVEKDDEERKKEKESNDKNDLEESKSDENDTIEKETKQEEGVDLLDAERENKENNSKNNEDEKVDNQKEGIDLIDAEQKNDTQS